MYLHSMCNTILHNINSSTQPTSTAMAIQNMIGAPVTGENFYGREIELRNAHRYLNERQSLLLSAPRRIGKSSMAKRLINDKTDEGWKCVYVDLQGIATKETFLYKLIDAFTGVGIMDKAGTKALNVFGKALNFVNGINLGDQKLELNDQALTEALFNRLSGIFDHSKDTLIVIDELPLFLSKLMDENGKNRNEIEFLLNWFRSIRQNENSHIRWLFCGSVGLRNFTNHYAMSQSINDLVDFELGELPPEEAKGLIEALAKSYKLSIDKALIDEILDQLQWPIPYFIQLLIDRLILKIPNPQTRPVTHEDIEEAITALSKSDKFITWSERLAEYRNLKSMAQSVLDHLSVTDDSQTKDDLLKIVMKNQDPTLIEEVKEKITIVLEMLEHDGYLIRSDKYRKFRSPLLRRWWANKFID